MSTDTSGKRTQNISAKDLAYCAWLIGPAGDILYCVPGKGAAPCWRAFSESTRRFGLGQQLVPLGSVVTCRLTRDDEIVMEATGNSEQDAFNRARDAYSRI